MPENIVIGQKVTSEKVALARELRRGMTRTEKKLWQELRANRLAGWHFRRQQVIAGFVADFYCHQASLAVEVDGVVHQYQSGYDRDRDVILGAMGITVLRIQNAQVDADLAGVLSQIQAACESAPALDRESGGLLTDPGSG